MYVCVTEMRVCGGGGGGYTNLHILFADYSSHPGDGSVSVVTVEGFHHCI